MTVPPLSPDELAGCLRAGYEAAVAEAAERRSGPTPAAAVSGHRVLWHVEQEILKALERAGVKHDRQAFHRAAGWGDGGA